MDPLILYQAIHDKLPDVQPIALYQTGSRLNNLANSKSDDDYLVLLTSTPHDLINQISYWGTVKLTFNQIKREVKFVDLATLYRKLRHRGNWQLLEALSQIPLDVVKSKYLPLLTLLSNSLLVYNLNPNKYLQSAVRQSMRTYNIAKHDKKEKHRWVHDLYLGPKYHEYLVQLDAATTLFQQNNLTSYRLNPQSRAMPKIGIMRDHLAGKPYDQWKHKDILPHLQALTNQIYAINRQIKTHRLTPAEQTRLGVDSFEEQMLKYLQLEWK